MTTEKITLTKLSASDGMMLTNGESYGATVYIGANDSPDNWYEITEEEAEKRKQEQNKEDEGTNENGVNV